MARRVFADTQYWIAAIDPADQWAHRAAEVTASLGVLEVITTDEVLVEVANALSGGGPHLRGLAARMVHSLRQQADLEVVPQSRSSLDAGLALFEARRDKAYSLTDCISMVTMRERGITEVLTHDHHFRQEGFVPLF